MENAGLTIDTNSLLLLLKTARWTMMLAIIMLIGMFIGGLVFLILLLADFTDIAGSSDNSMGMAVIVYGIFVVLLIGVHLYPAVQLINYRTHIKAAAETNDNERLYKALTCISNFFRYVVIAIITCTVLYIFVAVVAGVMQSI